jgi:hypothetical protein
MLKKNPTLRDRFESPKKFTKIKKTFLFTILSLAILTLAFSIGFSNPRTEKGILGLFDKQESKIEQEPQQFELKIIDEDDDPSEENDNTGIEEDSAPKTNTDVVSTKKTIPIETSNSEDQQPPNENIEATATTEETTTTETETVPEDNCSEEDISFYKQLISTAEKQILLMQNYINNPSCQYPYTPSTCQLTYDICKRDVEKWFEADGACSRLPRSSVCVDLKIEREKRLNLCEQEYNSCNSMCEEEIEKKLVESYLTIEDARTRIDSYKDYLIGCGVAL